MAKQKTAKSKKPLAEMETPLLSSSAPDPLPEQTSEPIEEPTKEASELVDESAPVEETLESFEEETFLDRLKIERDELKSKYEKLHSFLQDKQKAIDTVGKEHHTLLVSQLHHMDAYISVLDRRISLL
jgi:flagellar biosynthesis chaperone FliJ